MRARLAGLLLVALVRSAHAQHAAGEDEGKKHFDAGRALYRDHKIADALAEFERSYEIGGRAGALKNAAQCHRELQHFALAYEAYERLTKIHAAELSVADKDAVEHALSELRFLTGSIRVTVAEPDAALSIDGAPVADGATRRVSLAVHKVRVTKEGKDAFDKDVPVGSAQDVLLEVKLAAEDLMGHLVVREQQERTVRVFLDGKDIGPAPWQGDATPGDHTIEVKSSGFRSAPTPFSLAKKEHRDFTLDARPLTGHVHITTIPDTAFISIDGVGRGAGVWDEDLSPGVHRVAVVAAAGLRPLERQIVVVAGETLAAQMSAYTPSAPKLTHGFYAMVFVGGDFGLGTETYTLPSGVAGSVDRSIVGAIALKGAVGYTLGVVSVELVAVGRAVFGGGENIRDTSNNKIVNLGPGDAAATALSLDGFVGAGVRATTKPASPSIPRLTGALAAGAGLDALFAVDHSLACDTAVGAGGLCAIPPSAQSTISGTSYGFFGLTGDIGVLLGSVPDPTGDVNKLTGASSAALFLGVNVFLEIPPGVSVGPELDTRIPSQYFNANVNGDGRYYRMFTTPRLFVGPVLGVVF